MTKSQPLHAALRIKDRPGCITVTEMRRRFEESINSTPVFKSAMPLGVVSANGEFSHYANADTDTMWIGYAIGMRAAERIAGSDTKPAEEPAVAYWCKGPEGLGADLTTHASLAHEWKRTGRTVRRLIFAD